MQSAFLIADDSYFLASRKLHRGRNEIDEIDLQAAGFRPVGGLCFALQHGHKSAVANDGVSIAL